MQLHLLLILIGVWLLKEFVFIFIDNIQNIMRIEFNTHRVSLLFVW